MDSTEQEYRIYMRVRHASRACAFPLFQASSGFEKPAKCLDNLTVSLFSACMFCEYRTDVDGR
jgi:hypothetical protein